MIISLSKWPRRRRPSTTGANSILSASAPSTAPQPVLTDSQWNLIKDLFEDPDPSAAMQPSRAGCTGRDWPCGVPTVDWFDAKLEACQCSGGIVLLHRGDRSPSRHLDFARRPMIARRCDS